MYEAGNGDSLFYNVLIYQLKKHLKQIGAHSYWEPRSPK